MENQGSGFWPLLVSSLMLFYRTIGMEEEIKNSFLHLVTYAKGLLKSVGFIHPQTPQNFNTECEREREFSRAHSSLID